MSEPKIEYTIINGEEYQVIHHQNGVTYRPVEEDEVKEKLKSEIPGVEKQLKDLEEAQKVRQETLDDEITI